MNTHENQVAVTQEDIRIIRKEVTDFGGKLADIHYALVGNAMTKDGGLIQRVIDLEKEKMGMEDRIDKMEKDLEDRIVKIEKVDIKNRIYVKTMWGMAGGSISLLFAYIIEHLFKTK